MWLRSKLEAELFPAEKADRYIGLAPAVCAILFVITNWDKSALHGMSNGLLLQYGGAALGFSLLLQVCWFIAGEAGHDARRAAFLSNMDLLELRFDPDALTPRPLFGSRLSAALLFLSDPLRGKKGHQSWPQRYELLKQYYRACLSSGLALTHPLLDLYDSLCLLPLLGVFALVMTPLLNPLAIKYSSCGYMPAEDLLLVCLIFAALLFAVPSGSRYEAFNGALLDYLDAHPERLES